jgi:hypothetical protein
MSISNILNKGNSSPADVLLYCKGLRCSETCQCKSVLAADESTFFNGLNVFNLGHFYNNVKIDGNLSCAGFTGPTSFDNINCNSINCTGGITGASLHTTTITGTNSNVSGVAVSGSVITSNITMSGGFTAGQTGTVLNLKVNNSAQILNNLDVSNNISCDGNINTQTCNVSQILILPDLDTATRDSLPQQEASILYNNEVVNPQIYGGGLWNNISYWPQTASYFLNSDESVPNATIHKIGSVSDLKDIFISGPSDYFDYSGSGDFKIKISGIFNFSCTVALQPPTSDFHLSLIHI